jgi:hypothetical protein
MDHGGDLLDAADHPDVFLDLGQASLSLEGQRSGEPALVRELLDVDPFGLLAFLLDHEEASAGRLTKLSRAAGGYEHHAAILVFRDVDDHVIGLDRERPAVVQPLHHRAGGWKLPGFQRLKRCSADLGGGPGHLSHELILVVAHQESEGRQREEQHDAHEADEAVCHEKTSLPVRG